MPGREKRFSSVKFTHLAGILRVPRKLVLDAGQGHLFSRAESAVDDELGPGDERGFIAREIKRCCGDLLRLAHSPDRLRGGHFMPRLFGVSALAFTPPPPHEQLNCFEILSLAIRLNKSTQGLGFGASYT